MGVAGIRGTVTVLYTFVVRADDPLRSLSLGDVELFRLAAELLRDRGRPGKHSVAAAVRAGSSVYLGLDLMSRKSPICAEPAAISAANSAGDYDLDAIVAVCFRGELSAPVSISPCGACRELVSFHAPECRVLFEYEGRLVDVKARELFPYPVIFG